MANNYIYRGHFLNDKFNGPNEQLLIPNMMIYQGKIIQGRTTTLSLLLY